MKNSIKIIVVLWLVILILSAAVLGIALAVNGISTDQFANNLADTFKVITIAAVALIVVSVVIGMFSKKS